eukprot:gene9088-18830_t
MASSTSSISKNESEPASMSSFSLKLWTDKILPNWSHEMRDSIMLRNLCFEGIPSPVRGRVWQLLLGNVLRITPDLYEIFKKQAQKYLQQYEAELEAYNASEYDPSTNISNSEQIENDSTIKNKQNSISLIAIDLPRTSILTSSITIHNYNQLYKNIENVLHTFVMYRPDIGYVQGMTYVATILCFYLDEYSAFQSVHRNKSMTKGDISPPITSTDVLISDIVEDVDLMLCGIPSCISQIGS